MSLPFFKIKIHTSTAEYLRAKPNFSIIPKKNVFLSLSLTHIFILFYLLAEKRVKVSLCVLKFSFFYCEITKHVKKKKKKLMKKSSDMSRKIVENFTIIL